MYKMASFLISGPSSDRFVEAITSNFRTHPQLRCKMPPRVLRPEPPTRAGPKRSFTPHLQHIGIIRFIEPNLVSRGAGEKRQKPIRDRLRRVWQSLEFGRNQQNGAEAGDFLAP